MSGFLEEMAAASRQRLEGMVVGDPLAMGPPRMLDRFGEVFDLIAEIKPRSPSEGELGSADLVARAVSYELGGAAVISVLTEPTRFGGSLELLTDVRAAVSVPVMRKDFLVHRYQITEARCAGADGVLVIARMLSDMQLNGMLDVAKELGMFVLVEAFDRRDLVRLQEIHRNRAAQLVGVNARDLDTLQVNPEIHARLAPDMPQMVPVVAESAIHDPAGIEVVAGLGYRGVLVGSALMRADDPRALAAALIEAGRRAAEPVAT